MDKRTLQIRCETVGEMHKLVLCRAKAGLAGLYFSSCVGRLARLVLSWREVPVLGRNCSSKKTLRCSLSACSFLSVYSLSSVTWPVLFCSPGFFYTLTSEILNR